MDKINELNTITQQTKYDIVKDLLQAPKIAPIQKNLKGTDHGQNTENSEISEK